jgi:hypothetical protein
MNGIIEINHAEYAAKVKMMSIDELCYTVQDAKEAIDAMPAGKKAGYYADEINYCASEINHRYQELKDRTIKGVDFKIILDLAWGKLRAQLEHGFIFKAAVKRAKAKSCAGPAIWFELEKLGMEKNK